MDLSNIGLYIIYGFLLISTFAVFLTLILPFLIALFYGDLIIKQEMKRKWHEKKINDMLSKNNDDK